MSHTLRIGTLIWPLDPFWVQVGEAIHQRARQCGVQLVEIDDDNPRLRQVEDQAAVVEELRALDLDALISWNDNESLARRILDAGLPIVNLGEHPLRHPRFVSPDGLYEVARSLGAFLGDQLGGAGLVLAIGGQEQGADGLSRFNGLRDALRPHPAIRLRRITCPWPYQEAYPVVAAALRTIAEPIGALFGLSDSLALAARDAGRALGCLDEHTLIVGINGDPLALVAIAEGGMTATMQTSAAEFGAQALDLAVRGARGEPLPAHFGYRPRLVTSQNVAEVAMEQLKALAAMPTRLVGVRRQQEQQRLTRLETSLEINRRAGLILDRQRLSHAIAQLIRANYGYDEVQLFRYDALTQALTLEQADGQPSRPAPARLDDAPVFCAAVERDETVFIPDTYRSQRFAPDPLHPESRSRVVVPIRLGGQTTGLLDLHSYRATHHTHRELIDLQTLADQLGIALRNAELYGEAVEARVVAEKADRLKTVLLTNVSHELRTPLNVILGYSRAALDRLGGEEAGGLAQDIRQIGRSGEHLLRLINDLLDLSRAEIDELDLLPEMIDTRAFLEDVFGASASHFAGGAVDWRLELPPELPLIEADPVRLRQVLLNLLHNAHKFTRRGHITLGAALAPGELQLWVADTGAGISAELQEQIFDPFVSAGDGLRQRDGVGLGLAIARRLVALHHGRITVESRLGRGSTFRVLLPLPAAETGAAEAGGRPALLVVGVGPPPERLAALAQRRGLALHQLQSSADIARLPASTQPALLALDLAAIAMGGWDVVEQVRAAPQLARLPVMLFHGSSEAMPEVPGVATGLLLKPLDDRALLDALDDLDPRAPGGTILIVDDDPRTRALHRRLIGEHCPGYTIREAADGRAALEYLARAKPDLVVLDLVMPEADGFAVLEALRADLRTAAVPVLVLSGKALAADDIRRLAEARVVFHTKAVLSDVELAESIRRTLDRADPLPPQTSTLVKKAVAFMQQHYAEPISRQELALALGVSKDYLGRIFHQELGLSPWEYLIRYRVLRAKELLRTTDYAVAEVAGRVGFETATYFSHIFHREVGCSPRAFRAQPPGSEAAS